MNKAQEYTSDSTYGKGPQEYTDILTPLSCPIRTELFNVLKRCRSDSLGDDSSA